MNDAKRRMIQRLGRRGRPARERGQSLVEFALVLPIFLALVIGIVEFGAAWRNYQVLTNASREGARRAVVPNATDSEVRTKILEYLDASGLDRNTATILINVDADGNEQGASAETGSSESVRVEYPYSFALLGPVLDLLGGGGADGSFGTITLSSETVMRNE